MCNLIVFSVVCATSPGTTVFLLSAVLLIILHLECSHTIQLQLLGNLTAGHHSVALILTDGNKHLKKLNQNKGLSGCLHKLASLCLR